MRVKRLNLQDLPELFGATVDFFRESDNNSLTPDYNLWVANLVRMLSEDSFVVLSADIDGEIAGYSIPYFYREYTVEPIGEIYQFYVRPKHRGSGVARLLAQETCKIWHEWGCAVIYVEAASGVEGSTKLFSNLWKKQGFFETGVIMRKS